MAERVGEHMKLEDIIAFLGILFISAGCFIFNVTVGFIATGLLLVGVAFLMSRGGD